MSPIAVFLSSSELGKSSHPRPVFSGVSFPPHNFTEPVSSSGSTSMTNSTILLIFMLLRETWEQNHDGGDKLPPPLNLDLITSNNVVEGRANERTIRMKKMNTVDFQQHQSDWMVDFLNVWARTQVPIPTPVNFR